MGIARTMRSASVDAASIIYTKGAVADRQAARQHLSFRLQPDHVLEGRYDYSFAGTLVVGAAHCFGRRFDEAVPKLLPAIHEDPSMPGAYLFLAACYAHMGRLDDAREIIGRLRAITPFAMPQAGHFRNAEHRELYLSGLRLAAGETS